MAKPRKNEGPIEAALRASGLVLLREACEATGLVASTVAGHIEAKRIKAEVYNGCYWVKPEDVQALVPVVEKNKQRQKKIFSPGGGQNAIEALRQDDSQPDLKTSYSDEQLKAAMLEALLHPEVREEIQGIVRAVQAEQLTVLMDEMRRTIKELLS